jgi:hypothetical protein
VRVRGRARSCVLGARLASQAHSQPKGSWHRSASQWNGAGSTAHGAKSLALRCVPAVLCRCSASAHSRLSGTHALATNLRRGPAQISDPLSALMRYAIPPGAALRVCQR